MTDQLFRKSISWLAGAYRSRELSPVEMTTVTLERVEAYDQTLSAYVAVFPDRALQQAKAAEKEMSQGRFRGPLHGVPIGLKDLIDVAGMNTTGSSRVMRGNVSRADSWLAAALIEAGAIIIGKNTAYEFGLGLPSPGDWPPPARNPWDISRISGGSSSGSAAATLAGLCAASFGTDTGGSIRVPASYCGVVGLKPSPGLIATLGVLPLSTTLDHVGPLARSAEDAMALLAGVAPDFCLDPIPKLDGLRLGIPHHFVDGVALEEGIGDLFYNAVDTLRSLGAAIHDVSFPSALAIESTLLTIIESEALAHHKDLLSDSPELYGSNARQRLLDGHRHKAVDYVEALRQRADLQERFREIFGMVDVIVSPVAHQVAPTFDDFFADPHERTLFTGLYNLIGSPAVSVPCGRGVAEMPVGLQIAGPPGSDNVVLSVGVHFEKAISWADELKHLSEEEWGGEVAPTR